MLPGDKTKKQQIASMIRVNHAGEYGAKRIYLGQLDYIKDQKAKEVITHMASQEDVHLKYFEDEIVRRSIRPTILYPIWHIYGYALGAITAMLGTKAAMACTEAVEEVIDEHYQEQLKFLASDELELKEKIEKFRQEELEHKNIAIEYESSHARCYHFLSPLIKLSCKMAIRISKLL